VATTGLDRKPMRVAVVLPRHRLWRWHHTLLSGLAREYDVRVFVDDLAPPYRASLRSWLKFERALFGRREPAPSTSIDPSWRTSGELDAGDFEHIVDLSERTLDLPHAIEVRYDGAADSTVLIDCLLARRTPMLSVSPGGGSREPLQSRPAITDKSVLTRGLRSAHAHCISLIERALQGKSGPTIGEVDCVPAATGNLAAFAARTLAEKSFGIVDRFIRRPHHWSVALGNCRTGFSVVPDDGGCFYADPFLFRRGNQTFLFVEEFDYAAAKGRISAVEVVGDKPLGPLVPVLERPFHLSYPFVFAAGDTIYMVPESSQNRSLDLYKAVDFPWRWELERTLFEGVELSDATLLFHQGLWWLFAAAARDGVGGHDQLSLFYSSRLFGPWTAHPQNPLKSDCRSARPGGRIIDAGGRLLRPAQDCEKNYGAGLAWFEIDTLTPSTFRETELMRWNAERDLGMGALHHFDQSGELQAIDFARPVGRGVLRKPLEAITTGGRTDLKLPNCGFLSTAPKHGTSNTATGISDELRAASLLPGDAYAP
jgi:hypothetical protein